MGPYFIAGVKNNKCSGAACIRDLSFQESSDLHIDGEWKVLFALDALVSLGFRYCRLDNSSLAHLVELIPLMTNLQMLTIKDSLNLNGNNYLTLLEVLHQTNVYHLSFGTFHDDLAPNLYDDYCSASRRLIHPCTGKLEELVIFTRTYN